MKYQRSALLASACAYALAMSAAYAEETPPKQSSTSLDEVVVTGTFIATRPEDAAISVEVVNYEALQNLGRPSNLDMVKNLTEVGYSAGEGNRNNGWPIDAATINLRSLGPRFTTVVFNNRRFPEQFTPAFGRFNNIASIPNAAIGSVEVLRTGGAAIYGADAVAGVVNYVTRKSFKGAELTGDFTRIIGSNGDYSLNGIWGTELGGGDLIVAAGWQHRSKLEATAREFTNHPYLENPPPPAGSAIIAAGWNVISEPADYSFQRLVGAAQATYTPTSGPYAGQRQMGFTGTVRDPGCQALGGYAGWSATPSPVCYGNASQVESLLPTSDDYSLYGEYNLKFATTMKFHLETLFYYRDLPEISVRTRSFPTVYPSGATTQQSGYFVNGANPAVGYFLRNMFLNPDGSTAFSAAQITAIENTGRATIAAGTWSMFSVAGNPLGPDFDLQRNTTTQYRISTSLGGALPSFGGTDLEWEVAATYHYVKDTRDAKDMLVDRLQSALNGFGGPNCVTGSAAGTGGCGYFNPFSSAIAMNQYTGNANSYFVGSGSYAGYVSGMGLANDPNLVQWLYAPVHLDRTYKMSVLDPIIRGSTGINLPGGPIKIAVGGQVRYSTQFSDYSELSDITVNPCATIGATNCLNYPTGQQLTGVFVYGRSAGLLGANTQGRVADEVRRYPVYAGFLETNLPILDSLDLDIAGRYEKFISDYTDKHNHVVVPSASLKWTPTSWVSFRGSYGQTFGQASPPQYDVPSVTTQGTAAAFPQFSALAGTTFNAAGYHNQNVEPEKGENMSVGFIVRTGNFHATVDYNLLSINNYLRTLSTSNVVNSLIVQGQSAATLSGPLSGILINCASALLTQTDTTLTDPQSPGGRSVVQLNSTSNPANACSPGVTSLQSLVGGRVSYFNGVNETNGGKLWSNSIDFSVSYSFNLGNAGILTPTLDGTYITKWFFGDFNLNGVKVASGFDGVGYRNDGVGRSGSTQFSIPQYRLTLGLNYHLGKHTVNVNARFTPSVIDDAIAGAPGEPAPALTSNVYNANIAGLACPATSAGFTSNIGSSPTGAGTNEYGALCSNQNVTALSGAEIASFLNIDLGYRFAMSDKVSINAYISNLLNKDPSFAREQLAYDAGFGSPLLRTYKLGATVKF